MNLKSIEGKAKLYYGVCSNYPNCNFQEDQLNKLETEKDINNNIFIKKVINNNMTKPYSDPEFQVAVVYCTNDENEKDCEYFITLSNENEEINIIENEKYYSSVKGYQIDKYSFDIRDSTNKLEYLYIDLYSYHGQGTITVYSDQEMTKEINTTAITSIQNHEIAVIKASSLPNKSLNGNYYIKIRGLTNTIYSINYYTKLNNDKLTEYYLLSNEVNIQALNLNNEEISFLIKNKAAYKNVPFLFEYNSLNCELEVSLYGESGKITERNYQYIIDNSKTFMVNSPEDQVTLFFKKNSNYIIDFSYAFDNSDLTTYKVVNIEKSLVFKKDELNEKCLHPNEFCSIKIQIKINDQEIIKDNSYIDFILIANNKVTYPNYLQNNQLIQNLLQTNQYQYYYLDIGKNEECDIILDFNEGSGQAIAKIVQKDIPDSQPNYNRRVLLPLPGMTGNYVFDQYSKELKITKDMTSKCEKGCEIYIAIFHSDQRFTDLISSFNIYYRKNDNIVYLPENKIVHGLLNSIEDKNIFRTKINKNTKIIIFNLLGEHTIAYINKGETIPTSENKDYVIDTENDKQLIITSNDSFEDQIFTYVVVTNKLENKYYRSYDIKIDTPDSESVNIKLIDYLHNYPCYFNKNNVKCNYILPVEMYSKETKLYLFTPDNKNTYIYANSISMEEYDSLTTDEKYKKLPKKRSDSKDYLLFDISGRYKDIYILISVETSDTETESVANLVVGGFYYSSTTYFRPNIYNFYSLTNDVRKELNLAIESQDLYEVNFVFISGNNGIISQSQLNKEFEFGENTNKYLTFLFDPELKSQKLFNIKFNTNNNINEANDGELYFYAYLEQRSNASNIANIKYSELLEQKIEFLKNEQIKNFFPLSFYE